MKKTVCAVIMSLFLVLWSAPASALMVDLPTIAAKISEMVGKIADMTTKITQQVSQIKQMSAQGFSKAALFELATTYATDYGKALIKQKQQAFIKSTREKNLKNMEKERDTYKDNAVLAYDEKIKIAGQNQSEADENRKKAKKREQNFIAEINSLTDEYERAKAADDLDWQESVYEKLALAKMDLESARREYIDANTLYNNYEEQTNNLKEAQAKIGTADDKKYQEYTMRMDALKKEDTSEDKNKDFVFKDGGDREWDTQGIVENFSPTEDDYNEFMERYFYNPKDLNAKTGAAGRTEYQSAVDKVARERRFLVTNTAAHLLQVTATLRREIPVRTTVMDETFQNTVKASGELEAISSYSATRIENMKALLMYAKLQSARLQYMAAKELLKLDGVKLKTGGSNRDYSEFNLGHYMLTEDYLNTLYNAQNPEAEEDTYENKEEFNAIQ